MTSFSPPPSSFIGRRQELEATRQALAEGRLVTLTGPGGVGKTRIASEAADRVHRAFPDGVWFVGLADIDPQSTLDTLAAGVLRVLTRGDQAARGNRERLLDYLADRHLLLVVDNCEHLLPLIAQLSADMLSAAPHVKVLSTSREALRITGEKVLLVPPLATPALGGDYTVTELLTFDAVSLLVDRAQSTTPGFELTATNASAVVRLCNQLDGLPLAIELAATRLRSLTPAQMAERIADRFLLLSAGDRTALPRQQSLRAVIDWSYDLCTPATRLLWNRLAVFPGSFDITMAEQVCGFGDLAPQDVFDGIDRLVSQSVLLTSHTEEGVRYRLLTTLREYASAKLNDAEEYDTLRCRHLDFVLKEADAVFHGALPRPHAHHADTVAALHYSTSERGDACTGLQLAVALGWHWVAEGYLDEGRRWLDILLREGPRQDSERSEALWAVIWVALIQNDRAAAAHYLQELSGAAHTSPTNAANFDHWMGLYEAFSSDPAPSVAKLERAVHAHAATGNTAMESIARFQLAFALLSDHQLERAVTESGTALATSRTHGLRHSQDWATWILGVAHWRLGDHDVAEQTVRTLLRSQEDTGDYLCLAASTALLGWIAASHNNHTEAERLMVLSDNLFAGIGTTIEFFGPRIAAFDREAHPTRTPTPTAAPPQGLKAVVDLALGTAPPNPSPLLTSNPLTTRELEVARLVAQGLTNKQVAEKLVISRRTAEGHIERILRKLELTSRAAIASWITQQGSKST